MSTLTEAHSGHPSAISRYSKDRPHERHRPASGISLMTSSARSYGPPEASAANASRRSWGYTVEPRPTSTKTRRSLAPACGFIAS